MLLVCPPTGIPVSASTRSAPSISPTSSRSPGACRSTVARAGDGLCSSPSAPSGERSPVSTSDSDARTRLAGARPRIVATARFAEVT
jgi:hypothetical protein